MRESDAGLVVIGRCPELKEHYESLAGRKFHQPYWLVCGYGEVLRIRERDQVVLRVPYRPSGSSRRVQFEAGQIQARLSLTLPATLAHCPTDRVAMLPVSCRNNPAVFAGMTRTIWDLSISAFLGTDPVISNRFPDAIDIYCHSDADRFADYLENGHYASINHGWHFNTNVCCDRAKRARYLRRRRFRFTSSDTDERKSSRA